MIPSALRAPHNILIVTPVPEDPILSSKHFKYNHGGIASCFVFSTSLYSLPCPSCHTVLWSLYSMCEAPLLLSDDSSQLQKESTWRVSGEFFYSKFKNIIPTEMKKRLARRYLRGLLMNLLFLGKA